jgi:hypothetical protein
MYVVACSARRLHGLQHLDLAEKDATVAASEISHASPLETSKIVFIRWRRDWRGS